MALPKQAIPVNFSKGIDSKNDPFQLEIGKFLSLENSVFTTGGRLTKRNGFGSLPALPSPASYATTFNGDLTAIGNSIEAYSSASSSWVQKGSITPASLSTLPLIRNNLNQIYADTAIAANGLVCTAYIESNGSTNAIKYAIADSTTGQNIVAPTVISGADATTNSGPRVFFLGAYFVIVYAAPTSRSKLAYIAISTSSPALVTGQVVITTSFDDSTGTNFDGVVFSNALYLAWNGASASGIKMAQLTSTLVLSAVTNPDASHVGLAVSVCADAQASTIWVNYYAGGNQIYSLALTPGLSVISGFPLLVAASSGSTLNVASAAQGGVATVFYEDAETASGIVSDTVFFVTVSQSSASVLTTGTTIRSLGLASKAFIVGGVVYFLGAYQSTYQSTYFLINGSTSTSANPVIVAKLAYENGGGYTSRGLSSVSVFGATAGVAYLNADIIEPISNSNSSGTAVQGGIYAQTGINLATIVLASIRPTSSEIGSNLNISGGYLTAYDGYLPVENGFHLWPDSVQATATATTGGHLKAQIYFYQVTYEWSDNQGNIFRSAGSIPIKKDISGSGTSTNTITLVIPTLRVTQKTANPVKIVIYRWSTDNQVFYQTTSVSAPTLNDTTIDSITYVDTLADASIIGNSIIYTAGGVIENIGAPATSAATLFDDRLWLVASEDKNLLWFSKQVIEATPVEMSDLLTLYVAPSIGATGPTGPILSLSAMDDKLVVFKQNAAYYVNGTGPDNTGANNQYSQPIFITSMVGCSNQGSIVFQPSGLMFEFASEAGNQIWLLGRDLQTQYIGSPVEAFTKNATVLSAIAVPGTNQVRFNLSSGITLMYDYFYGQWGTFSSNAISSALFQDLHTYIAPNGYVYQETPGVYLDGTNPVLLSFTTSWINVAGLRGYQRAYRYFLLGQYLSPFRLMCSTAYNYKSSPSSFAMIQPNNFSPAYGSAEANGQVTTYGSDNPYGGVSNILNWRVNLKEQRCSSLQITIQEIYDPSFGIVAGAGFTLSGLSLIVSAKQSFRTISAAESVASS